MQVNVPITIVYSTDITLLSWDAEAHNSEVLPEFLVHAGWGIHLIQRGSGHKNTHLPFKRVLRLSICCGCIESNLAHFYRSPLLLMPRCSLNMLCQIIGGLWMFDCIDSGCMSLKHNIWYRQHNMSTLIFWLPVHIPLSIQSFQRCSPFCGGCYFRSCGSRYSSLPHLPPLPARQCWRSFKGLFWFHLYRRTHLE